MDVLLIFLAIKSPHTVWWCAGLAVVGSALGNLVLFLAARKGGQRYMERSTTRRKGLRFEAWFGRYGLLSVFVPAFVPFIFLPLKLFVISAGVFKTSTSSFLRVILAARILRYFGEVWLGLRLGDRSLPYLKSHLWGILCGTLLLVGAFYVVLRFWSKSVVTNAPAAEHETVN